MGIYCSSETDDSSQHAKQGDRDIARNSSKQIAEPSCHQPPVHLIGYPSINKSRMIGDQYNVVSALDHAVTARSREQDYPQDNVLDAGNNPHVFRDANDYGRQREALVTREGVLAFDYLCRVRASPLEIRANQVLQAIRKHDNDNIYDKAPKRRGYGGQEHPRFMGDHFLYNADLLEETKLYRVAQRMPKGAHLHIHFNANLLPEVLINIAKKMDRMFITSDIPLVTAGDESSLGYYDSFDRCKLQFYTLGPEMEKPGNLFDSSYTQRGTMRFQDFLKEFDRHYNKGKTKKGSVDEWLRNKLVFHEKEAHDWLQTPEGAWEKFNGRTQMMKGLFNYETAYREYTRLCLQDFVNDNIQYAEIRPNFMKANQLWTDDGTKQINNTGIMELIIEEYTKFQNANPGAFGGLKIIYCTPRSFSNDAVWYSLNECLEFKKRWPEWIAGYDLVGEESKGFPLKQFIPEFIAFKKKCVDEEVDIPFLFHCGETLGIGDETDGNLIDALLLGAKRIGHGFALPRHPYVMEQMKRRNMCVEICPISNEVLGLTPRVSGHAMYNLLANNVACTLSTDNGTIFRSRLSHDFYQAFAGKADMTIHGWRQLIEWSIEHSCMEDKLRSDIYTDWERRWNVFCEWIVKEYGYLAEGVTLEEAQK